MAVAVSLGSAIGSPRPWARLRKITASSRLMLAAISAVLSRAIGLRFSIGPLWRVWAVAGPLASGENPLQETITVKIPVDKQAWTGILLEVLPHDTLPTKGPGRAPNGNFVLNEFKATFNLEGQKPTPLPLTNPKSTFNQPTFPIANAIDNNLYKLMRHE